MSELHFPWLESSVMLALIGAIWVSRLRDQFVACRHTLVFNSFTLVMTVGAWIDYDFLNPVGVEPKEAQDLWTPLNELFGREILVIDSLSAPLLTLVALLYFLVTLTTLRTKIPRFNFAWNLISEAIVLAIYSCESPTFIVPLLVVETIPPFLELRSRGQNTGVYVTHMAVYVCMLLIGWSFIEREGGLSQVHSMFAIIPILVAIYIRSGIAPFHCWVSDLYDRTTFGTALLFTMPLVGAYVAIRLLLPIAPDWIIRMVGILSLTTAVYTAGIALVQTNARRFFCYLFLSHSSLVIAGFDALTDVSLTGALCVWLATSVSLGGFGLTIRAIEARRGRLSLTTFQGLYDHTPALAVLFMITGLASVGFPGTFGFVGAEMLVDGAVEAFPLFGVAVVIATALNGIAVVHAYFQIFTGTRHKSDVSLGICARERFAVITLTALIFLGGIFPQYNVASRHRAAHHILSARHLIPGEHPTRQKELTIDHH